MKIVIVGPGALGCLIAGLIQHKTKDEVWLLDKRPERANRLAKTGVRIEGLSGSFTEHVNVTADPRETGIADLIIVCVKSHATEDVCKACKEISSDTTHILTLQNGIGNVQVLNDHFGQERVIAGVTNHGATLVDCGHVKHAGKGDTVIGKADGRVLGAVRDVAQLLTKAGFESKVSKDIDSVVWSKLVISVGINAVTAMTRLRNGLIVELDDTREVLRASVQEAVKIVKRKRIKLAYDDPIQKVESVCKATADNLSSMLQDVLAKKRTEIDFINGAIVRQGKALGISVPVNETLTRLVRAVESGYGAK